MTAKVGDTIVIEFKKVTQAGRSGVIEEILQAAPARYRVRWTDGKESIVAPSAGAARIEPKRSKNGTTRKPRATARKPRAKK